MAYLDSGKTILDQINAKELLYDNLKLRISLLERVQGDPGTLLETYKEMYALKEDLFQEEKLKLKEAETSYILSRNEQDKLRLEQEFQLSKAENERYFQFIVFLAVTILLSAVLATVQVKRWKERSRFLEERSRLLEAHKLDIKHRSYNILTRIQALLRRSAEGFEDEQLKQRLLYAEGAIISAASLQEFTYGIENEKKVSLGQYLKGLVERLKEIFDMTGNAISYKVDIQDECLLSVDTVLNCGIILSEIVTNSTKYAFNEKIVHPEITVFLKREGNHLYLNVRDNGVGLQENGKKGKGSTLIENLVKYIHAELEVQSGEGTSYTLKLKHHYT